jgi:hypothetical protein
MKKVSTIYLLGAIMMLGSCARQYPVFNQMPTNAYIQPKDKVQPASQPAVESAAVAVVVESEPAVVETPASFSKLMAEPQVAEMLNNKTPKQIDEQLELALATTKGKELMAKPAIASQINKVREMLAKDEFQSINASDVKSPVVSKMIDKQLKKSMEPKEAKALNNKIRIGLILILIGLLLGLIPGLGWALGGIVSAVGVVFVILGLVDNI